MQSATLKWLDSYQKGHFEVTIDTSDLDQHIDRLNVSTERLMAGMVLGGMLVGSAVTMAAVPQTEIGIYIRLVTFAIFAIAAGLGLWPVLRILWRGFREERALNEHNPWKS